MTCGLGALGKQERESNTHGQRITSVCLFVLFLKRERVTNENVLFSNRISSSTNQIANFQLPRGTSRLLLKNVFLATWLSR